MNGAGIGASAAMLRGLARGLDAAASGGAERATAERMRAELVELLEPVVAAHIKSGRALETLEVTVDGGRIAVRAESYLNFHDWWPLREGLPPSIAARAMDVFREETARLLASR